MNVQKFLTILKYIATAILGALTAIGFESCTTTFSLNKAGCNQTVKTLSTTSVDSTSIDISPEFKKK